MHRTRIIWLPFRSEFSAIAHGDFQVITQSSQEDTNITIQRLDTGQRQTVQTHAKRILFFVTWVILSRKTTERLDCDIGDPLSREILPAPTQNAPQIVVDFNLSQPGSSARRISRTRHVAVPGRIPAPLQCGETALRVLDHALEAHNLSRVSTVPLE